eukprot:3932954-Rhodomonas_salina.3
MWLLEGTVCAGANVVAFGDDTEQEDQARADQAKKEPEKTRDVDIKISLRSLLPALPALPVLPPFYLMLGCGIFIAVVMIYLSDGEANAMRGGRS